MHEVELVPGGGNIPVTFENREEYIKTYVNYIFQISCKDKYRRFEEVFFGKFSSIFFVKFEKKLLEKIWKIVFG